MLFLVKLIGFVIMGFGVAFLMDPGTMKKVIDFFEVGKRVYAAAIGRIVLAVILLLVASQAKITWIIVALGIIFLVSGILVFSMGVDKCKAMIGKIRDKQVKDQRLIALIPLVAGILILLAA